MLSITCSLPFDPSPGDNPAIVHLISHSFSGSLTTSSIISFTAMAKSTRNRGVIVVYLPVGEIPGICCKMSNQSHTNYVYTCTVTLVLMTIYSIFIHISTLSCTFTCTCTYTCSKAIPRKNRFAYRRNWSNKNRNGNVSSVYLVVLEGSKTYW